MRPYQGRPGIFRGPDLEAALFFAFFMADDPLTCPARYGGQVTFGVIVAVASCLVFVMNGGGLLPAPGFARRQHLGILPAAALAKEDPAFVFRVIRGECCML